LKHYFNGRKIRKYTEKIIDEALKNFNNWINKDFSEIINNCVKEYGNELTQIFVEEQYKIKNEYEANSLKGEKNLYSLKNEAKNNVTPTINKIISSKVLKTLFLDICQDLNDSLSQNIKDNVKTILKQNKSIIKIMADSKMKEIHQMSEKIFLNLGKVRIKRNNSIDFGKEKKKEEPKMNRKASVNFKRKTNNFPKINEQMNKTKNNIYRKKLPSKNK
jgi:hypothetical protein